MGSFFKKILGYFIPGLIFWLPIGIIVVIVIYLFNNLETLGENILSFFVPADFIYQGFGFILWLVLFFLTGLLIKKTPIGRVFSKIPFLGIFFRQDGEAMTIERLSHLDPCLFLFSPTCLSYGWIISKEKVGTNDKENDFTMYNVYYPNFPSLFTGQVYLVRKENIVLLGNSSKEVINLFLFAIVSPERIKLLPWEDESEEDFMKRVNAFGLNKSAG